MLIIICSNIRCNILIYLTLLSLIASSNYLRHCFHHLLISYFFKLGNSKYYILDLIVHRYEKHINNQDYFEIIIALVTLDKENT